MWCGEGKGVSLRVTEPHGDFRERQGSAGIRIGTRRSREWDGVQSGGSVSLCVSLDYAAPWGAAFIDGLIAGQATPRPMKDLVLLQAIDLVCLLGMMASAYLISL